MEVHKTLGPGFLEAVYEEALAYELKKLGLSFERQKVLAVYYKGVILGDYRTDFVVEGSMIIELKAQKALTAVDEAQLINYLKATNLKVGLLFNFGARSLQQVRRIV